MHLDFLIALTKFGSVMECNKDEAFKAKDIAEKHLQSKDFNNAHRFVLKAQRLYPEMENISQLLSVCDVHCAADKSFGNDKDWYGILQVEQAADDTLIKKQYRKLALLLHPDKNQFAGAEAAFKLIGEAQRILLDKDKRAFHDIKRRTSFNPVIQHQPPQQASRNVSQVKQSRPQTNSSGNPNSHVKAASKGQTHQSQPNNGKETFWTNCLNCSVRYQYYKEVMGRALRCQGCKNLFVAYDMHASRAGAAQPGNLEPEAKYVKPTSASGIQAGKKTEVNRSQKGQNAQGDEGSNLQKTNGQRKKHLESSESFESDSSLDSEEMQIHEAAHPRRPQHLDSDGEQTRRSNRNKRHVSYDENARDYEQVATSSKKAKVNASTEEKVDASNIFGSVFGEGSRKKEVNSDDRNETLARSTGKSVEANTAVDSSLDTSESTPEPTYFEYPDPEFCDFDKFREEHCFKVGQIWAAYDTADAMPRYYAKIKKIYASGFKLQITWLEPDPDDDVGREWINSDLPFSCGKFKMGDTENTEDRLMFSHVVCGCKIIGRNSFIYPRVGEIWSIFKDWDPKWCSVPENERKFEYEFVEILTDYDKSVGIRVAPLSKLKGFASLFCRRSVSEIQIRPAEVLRFSHMVPSYRISGSEDKAAPKGCIELDPGSTTMNIEEITLPELDKNNSVDNPSNYADVNVNGNSNAGYCENRKGDKEKHRNGLK